MVVTDKEWNLIKAAAEKTKNTGIHKKLDQGVQNGNKLNTKMDKKLPYTHLLFSCDECNLPFIEEMTGGII